MLTAFRLTRSTDEISKSGIGSLTEGEREAERRGRRGPSVSPGKSRWSKLLRCGTYPTFRGTAFGSGSHVDEHAPVSGSDEGPRMTLDENVGICPRRSGPHKTRKTRPRKRKEAVSSRTRRAP